MYHYRTYGLRLSAPIPLPELQPETAVPAADAPAADVTLIFGDVPAPPGETTVRYVSATADDVILSWDDVGAIRIRGGREVIVAPLPGVAEEVLRLFLLGTTLAVVLHQRRALAVFHASVAAVNGQAAAFVGQKGAGKSTMAATLHAAGHTLLADDALAVDLAARPARVEAGFPHLKLWPDAAASLGLAPETLPQLRPEFDKRSYQVAQTAVPPRLPLGGVFLLGFGAQLRVERLTGREALAAIMPHWYGARLGEAMLQALGRATHFQECAALVQQVPVYYLERPSALPRLPEVAKLVETCLAAAPRQPAFSGE